MEEGYGTVEDIDRTIKYGLGLRWSFMGPFETVDLNDPGGIERGVEAFAKGSNSGLIVTGSSAAAAHRNLIITLAVRGYAAARVH